MSFFWLDDTNLSTRYILIQVGTRERGASSNTHHNEPSTGMLYSWP